jgi:hypothetical protein
MAVHITCENKDCVWRFSNGHCTRKNLKVDENGTCQGQEGVNKLMTQYPGSNNPGVIHGSHGYTQGRGKVFK